MTELNIPTEQLKRQHSADIAMAHRQWTILDRRGGWQVKTPTNLYTIIPKPERLICSCPDNQRYGALGVECKHICGLRIYLDEGGAPRQLKPVQKGEKRMNTEDLVRECGWVKLFHPSNAQVTIPLFLDKPILVAEAQALMASVTSLLQAGFSVEVPGLEDGEHEEEIGFVVRRTKANADGTETPVVDIYPSRGNFRLLGKYLNNEADIQTFEASCGVALNSLPLYEGDNSVERGKNPKLDKYVITLKRPVKVVWKLNPRYDGGNDKRNSKRLFVRWADLPSLADGNLILTPAVKLGLEEAKSIICPMGSKSHPELKGMPLGQVAHTEDGCKMLEYIASSQYQPNGNQDGQRAKSAAKLLLESLQPV